MVGTNSKMERKKLFNFVNSDESIKPQHAVQRLYELLKIKILILLLRLDNIKCGLLNIINLINQIDG